MALRSIFTLTPLNIKQSFSRVSKIRGEQHFFCEQEKIPFPLG